MSFGGKPEPVKVDALTGCRTWRQLKSDLRDELFGSGWEDRSVYKERFLCLNIEQFKVFVDHHGMEESNLVLADVGKQLNQLYPSVYRSGGEKFVAIIKNGPPVFPSLPTREYCGTYGEAATAGRQENPGG